MSVQTNKYELLQTLVRPPKPALLFAGRKDIIQRWSTNGLHTQPIRHTRPDIRRGEAIVQASRQAVHKTESLRLFSSHCYQ